MSVKRVPLALWRSLDGGVPAMAVFCGERALVTFMVPPLLEVTARLRYGLELDRMLSGEIQNGRQDCDPGDPADELLAA